MSFNGSSCLERGVEASDVAFVHVNYRIRPDDAAIDPIDKVIGLGWKEERAYEGAGGKLYYIHPNATYTFTCSAFVRAAPPGKDGIDWMFEYRSSNRIELNEAALLRRIKNRETVVLDFTVPVPPRPRRGSPAQRGHAYIEVRVRADPIACKTTVLSFGRTCFSKTQLTNFRIDKPDGLSVKLQSDGAGVNCT